MRLQVDDTRVRHILEAAKYTRTRHYRFSLYSETDSNPLPILSVRSVRSVALRGGGDRIYGGGAVGGLVTPDATDLDRSSLSRPEPIGTPNGTGNGAATWTGAGMPGGYNPIFHGATLPPTPGAAERLNGALAGES